MPPWNCWIAVVREPHGATREGTSPPRRRKAGTAYGRARRSRRRHGGKAGRRYAPAGMRGRPRPADERQRGAASNGDCTPITISRLLRQDRTRRSRTPARFGVSGPGRDRLAPMGRSSILESARADPAGQRRRIDIGRIGHGAGDPGKAGRRVVGNLDRTGLLAELDESAVAPTPAGPDRRRRTARTARARPAGADRAACGRAEQNRSPA